MFVGVQDFGGALVEQGGNTWYFLTADYAFGYSLEENTGNFVKANGGAGSAAEALVADMRALRDKYAAMSDADILALPPVEGLR